MNQNLPEKAQNALEGARPLVQYRLYFLESVDGLISYSHEFEADCDELAVPIAEGWRQNRRAELWTGARKVKTWDQAL